MGAPGAGAAAAGVIAPVLDAGISLFNIFNQNKQNRINREFAQSEREAQYQSELEFWRMNNAYNHPSEQMARLREGGLNPHLVYGTGAVGNSSSAPHAPQPARWQGNAPQIQGISAVGMLDTYQNLAMKKAQTDNFREQNTILKNEAKLQQMGLIKKAFDLDVDFATKQSLIKQIQHSANIAENRDAGTYNQEMRNMELHTVEMELKKAGLKGQKLLNRINHEKAVLYEAGFNPNDPVVLRYLGRILLDTFGEDPIGQGVGKIKAIIGKWK